MAKITEYHRGTYYYTYYYYQTANWNYSDSVTISLRGKNFTFTPKLTAPNIAIVKDLPFSDKQLSNHLAYDKLNSGEGILTPTDVKDPFAVKVSRNNSTGTTDIVLYNRYKSESESDKVHIQFAYNYCDSYNYKGGVGLKWWDNQVNSSRPTMSVRFFDRTEDPRDYHTWETSYNTGGGSSSGGGT